MTTNSRKLFQATEAIFRQGDPPTCAYLVESGSIEIFAERDGQTTLISRLGPGDVLGEMAVLDDAPRTATAIAVRESVLTLIDRSQLNQRLAQADPIIRGLMLGQLNRYRSLLGVMQGKPDTIKSARAEETLEAEDFDSTAASKIRLEASLRDALQRGELQVHYQPIYHIARKKIAGYEALVRWVHPERGPVSPGEFIALAEETSLIVPVGHYVLRKACETIAAIRDAGASELPFIAVNVSARQLTETDMLASLIESANAFEISPTFIKFEITESLAINFDLVAQFIEHCHEQNVLVALDDFGTGYSNLGHLHKLPFDTVKLDQGFVRRMVEESRSAAIVRASVQMIRDLDADMVAEGVETEAQLLALGVLNCKYAQGWLIGKAMDREHAIQNHIA